MTTAIIFISLLYIIGFGLLFLLFRAFWKWCCKKGYM